MATSDRQPEKHIAVVVVVGTVGGIVVGIGGIGGGVAVVVGAVGTDG